MYYIYLLHYLFITFIYLLHFVLEPDRVEIFEKKNEYILVGFLSPLGLVYIAINS